MTAAFTLDTYEVSGIAGAHGTVVPESRTVAHGSTAQFQIQPDSGYDVASLDPGGCGGSLQGTLFTTDPVTALCSFAVQFTDDKDGDGVPKLQDNCPEVANQDQADMDGDGQGDPCDSDIDGDSMTNTWEITHGLSPYDSSDGVLDPDGDSFTNQEEFRFGTNPNQVDVDTNSNHIPDLAEARWHRVPALIAPLLLGKH